MNIEELIDETIARGGEMRLDVEPDLRRNVHTLRLTWKWPSMPASQALNLDFAYGDSDGHRRNRLCQLNWQLRHWFEKFEPPVIKLINALTGRSPR